MSSRSSADRASGWPDARGDVPGTILTALDGSRFSESALAHAAGFARALGGGLHLVTVLDPLRTGATSRTSAEARLQCVEALTTLERLAAGFRSRVRDCTFEVREGQPSAEILDAARERGIDLIALAARPRGGREHLVSGSVLQGIVALGLPSLLVARGGRGSGRAAPASEATYRRIAVVVDGSPACHGVLRTATKLARPHGAEILLVHVLSAARGGLTGDSGAHASGARPVRGGPSRGPGVRSERTGGSLQGVAGSTEAAGGVPLRETAATARYLRVLERSVRGGGVAVYSRVLASWADADAAYEGVDLLVIRSEVAAAAGRGYGADARRLLLRAEVPVLALRQREGASPAEPRTKPALPLERRSARRTREWSGSRPDRP